MASQQSTSQAVQFRVYIGPREGSGLYVQARIFPSKAAMLAALRDESFGASGVSRSTQAAMETTASWTLTPRGRRLSPCIGRVNFYRGRLAPDVVSHELAHAMFGWAERKRLLRPRRDQRAEEQLCYALERMTRRFVERATRRGLL